MNVAPRRPLKTAAWTLRSLLCLSANMILHIHFILSDADLNNFYEALWGEGGPKLAKGFFFSFSLFIFQTVPRKPSCFFSFRFSFWKRERKEHERGHNESKKLWFMQRIPQTASLQQSMNVLPCWTYVHISKLFLVNWAVVILLCGVISDD